MAGPTPIAHLSGSSRTAGTTTPQDVIVLDPDGNPQLPAAASFWAVNHNPGANTKATITQASAGAGKRNVCTNLAIFWVCGTTAPAVATATIAVIDGASGGTTYLWGPFTVAVPAVAGANNGVALAGLRLVGTAATAMTIEFSAALGANTLESVSMSGFSVTAA